MNILGTEYTIKFKNEEEDPMLNYNCDGYCDPTTKKIVIKELKRDATSVDDLKGYQNQVIRHEMVHAFFHESGLSKYEEDEILVEFLAIQLPKLLKLSKEIISINAERGE